MTDTAQRLRPDCYQSDDGPKPVMVRDENGAFVAWSDHEALRARVKELETGGAPVAALAFPLNCPKCGAHDFGLYAATLQQCPHCLLARAEQAERERDDLRAKLDAQARYMSEVLNSGDGTYRP